MHTTVADTLRSAISRLSAFETARPDAEELLSRLLGLGRAELHTHGARAVSADEMARFDSWLRRRTRGEPVQYITGRAAFRDLDLAVGPAVLRGSGSVAISGQALRRACW